MDSVSPHPADGTGTPRPLPISRWWRPVLLLGLVAAMAGSVWGVYEWRRRPVPEPAEEALPEFVSPFLNTRPGVKYVGSARCGECHAMEAATYADHPMGRSVSSAAEWLPGQKDAAASFEASQLRHTVARRGKEVVHREFVPNEKGPSPAEVVAEVAFTIGSGRQGQSFVINQEGRFFQSPISWYVRDKAWGLSPGFARKNEHFSRAIPEECLFCHCNEAHIVPHTLNQFRPAGLRPEPIGCERCHGPGEKHVAARQGNEREEEKDLTIVNPRRLPPRLAEAVCEQCHLQGETRIARRGRSFYDYRPGLPLEQFVSVYVKPAGRTEGHKAVSHVEQMHQSRCYRASDGKMGCTFCHDPHVLPSPQKRVAWYRERCLNCHQDTSCTLPLAERRRKNSADSCIDCHMPRGDSANIGHTSITDHRVVRRPTPDAPAEKPRGAFLEAFHARNKDGENSDPRDLGLALNDLRERLSPPKAQRRRFAQQVCELLKPVVEEHPEDVAALEALGLSLWKAERAREALTVLEQALQRAPRNESALRIAALVTMELRDTERSVGYWRRVLEVNPYNWEHHGYLAQTLALRKHWTEAVGECRASLKLNPFEARTRQLLIDCLIQSGEREQARSEFATLLATHPPQPEKLRQWFEERLRSGR